MYKDKCQFAVWSCKATWQGCWFEAGIPAVWRVADTGLTGKKRIDSHKVAANRNNNHGSSEAKKFDDHGSIQNFIEIDQQGNEASAESSCDLFV
jgi:hypothetical protein